MVGDTVEWWDAKAKKTRRGTVVACVPPFAFPSNYVPDGYAKDNIIGARGNSAAGCLVAIGRKLFYAKDRECSLVRHGMQSL